MATTREFKSQPTNTSNSLSFLSGALHAVTGVISGKDVGAVSLFTLPQGAIVHGFHVGNSELFTKAGSIGVGIAGTAEHFAVIPTIYTGTHTTKAAQLNSALAAETPVLGTFFAAHGTTPGTLAVTCLFSLSG